MTQKQSALFYMSFFAVVSMLLMPLIIGLMELLNLPITLFFENSRYAVDNFIFFLRVTTFPLLALLLMYKLSIKTKNQNIFFLITFLLLAITSYFNFHTKAVLQDTNNALKLLFIGIPLGIYTSFVLTYFWRKIMVQKEYAKAQLLRLPLLLTLALLFIELISSIVFFDSFILSIYIMIGEFLKNRQIVDIFYLDYYGFAGLFLSLVTSTSALAMSHPQKKK